MHSSSWSANPGDVFPATCRMWLIRLAALSWRDRPDFALALLSTGSFARLSNGAPAPMVYSPYQLQYMYGNGPVILNIVVMWYSPAIRTKSLKKYCSYMSLLLPANIPLRFCKHQYMCKKYGNILLFIYYIGIWFSTGIYRLTLVIKHWNKIAFIYKMWQTGPEISWIRMFCVFIVI